MPLYMLCVLCTCGGESFFLLFSNRPTTITSLTLALLFSAVGIDSLRQKTTQNIL